MNKGLFWLLISLFTVGLAILLTATPYGLDDFYYMNIIGITENGVERLTISDLYKGLHWRFYNDNIRLANIITIFAMMLPKWIICSVSAICYTLSVLIFAKLAGIKQEQWASMAAFLFLSIFIMPWWGLPLAFDYQTNYLWASAIFAVCIYLFLRGKMNFWQAILGGILLGWWHEGFGLAALGGLGLSWLTFKQLRKPWQTVFLVILAIFFIGSLMVPGARGRISYQGSIPTTVHLYRTFYTLLPIFLFIVISIFTYTAKRVKLWKEPLWVAICGMSFVGIVLKINVNDSRAVWGPCLAACAGIMLYLHQSDWKFHKAFTSAIGGVCAVLILACLITADCLAIKQHSDFKALIEKEKDYDGKPAMIDITIADRTPLIAWGMFFSPLHYQSHHQYFKIPDEIVQSQTILPPALRDFTPDQAVETLPNGWWRTASGHLVRPHQGDSMDAQYAWQTGQSPMVEEVVHLRIFPFVSEADGTAYDFIAVIDALPFQRPITNFVEY